MNLEQRINAFVKLGEFLSQFTTEGYSKKTLFLTTNYFLMALNIKLKFPKSKMVGLLKVMFYLL